MCEKSLKISHKKGEARSGGPLAWEQKKGAPIPQLGTYVHINLGGVGTSWHPLPSPNCLLLQVMAWPSRRGILSKLTRNGVASGCEIKGCEKRETIKSATNESLSFIELLPLLLSDIFFSKGMKFSATDNSQHWGLQGPIHSSASPGVQ